MDLHYKATGDGMNVMTQLAQKKIPLNMTSIDTTKRSPVAEQGAHVAHVKTSSKKQATAKKGAHKARKPAKRDRNGTMIRHGGALFAPLPVVALAVAMIEPPFRAALMIGPPPLLSPRPFAAGLAAITMSTVAVRAQEEGRQAVRAETGPLHQYRFMRRHACPQAAWWTPAPVRVSLDLSVWSHLPEGDDIGASTVGAVGALSLAAYPVHHTASR